MVNKQDAQIYLLLPSYSYSVSCSTFQISVLHTKERNVQKTKISEEISTSSANPFFVTKSRNPNARQLNSSSATVFEVWWEDTLSNELVSPVFALLHSLAPSQDETTVW